MRVKLRAVHASPGGIFQPGTILDVAEAEARALVAGDYADLVDQAVKPPAERAEAEPARATTAMTGGERRTVEESEPTTRRRPK